MPAEIGATLREARMRARIDVSEIEAQTKIRAKYLRALENEEWDLLPGPTFVKSFLRTYAQALGLDDKALVEEYRQHYERPNETDLQPIVPTTNRTNARERGGGRAKARAARGGRGPSRGYVIAIGAVSLVIVLLIVGLLTSGSSNNTASRTSARSATAPRHRGHGGTTTTPTGTAPAGGVGTGSGLVALSLRPTAPVYVCLIDASHRKLIPGLILQPSATEPTYHSHRFTITLGNASVGLLIDGALRTVPPSSQAIGYSITKAGGRHTLPPGQLPTCK
jgi:cytoskeleton protein RodZ